MTGEAWRASTRYTSGLDAPRTGTLRDLARDDVLRAEMDHGWLA